MARKRGAERDEDDGRDREPPRDYQLKGSGARRKGVDSRRQQTRRLPTRVTPEQILSNAAAAALKKRRQHEEPESGRREQPPAAFAAQEYDNEGVEVTIAAKSRRRDERVVAVKPEPLEPLPPASGAVLTKAAVYEEEAEEDEEEVDHEGEHGPEEDDEEDDDEEDEVSAPVVFQCGTCRSVFGDSYAFVGSNAELLLVTLSAVTNVTTGAEPQTSRDGADAGSSFQELLCAQCQTVLGRSYLTTPLALDALRGLFSFATTAIASYQLGYPQLQAAVAGGGRAATRETRAVVTDDAVALAADRRELCKLREDMTKVQNLLLVVDERLLQLEDAHEGSAADSEGDELEAVAAATRLRR
ncbi:hypothetical protein PybrP1_010020 [[Pythium] brassicae (nom. inval.)]|nr:hypothetical protein PybrP1_010020 [[Pythium] brassicae (nom. inval.)]